MVEKVALWTAIFSAAATALAALATWKAPRSAAALAESLRRDAERFDQIQKQKMTVFIVLMQERARIYSKDGVRALNSVDIVFSDSQEVRDSWSNLYNAFGMRPIVDHVIHEHLHGLLTAIARDLGIADKLRAEDMERVYYPELFQQEESIRNMQRQQELGRLMQQNAANPAAAWPPKPS